MYSGHGSDSDPYCCLQSEISASGLVGMLFQFENSSLFQFLVTSSSYDFNHFRSILVLGLINIFFIRSLKTLESSHCIAARGKQTGKPKI